MKASDGVNLDDRLSFKSVWCNRQKHVSEMLIQRMCENLQHKQNLGSLCFIWLKILSFAVVLTVCLLGGK